MAKLEDLTYLLTLAFILNSEHSRGIQKKSEKSWARLLNT